MNEIVIKFPNVFVTVIVIVIVVSGGVADVMSRGDVLSCDAAMLCCTFDLMHSETSPLHSSSVLLIHVVLLFLLFALSVSFCSCYCC